MNIPEPFFNEDGLYQKKYTYCFTLRNGDTIKQLHQANNAVIYLLEHRLQACCSLLSAPRLQQHAHALLSARYMPNVSRVRFKKKDPIVINSIAQSDPLIWRRILTNSNSIIVFSRSTNSAQKAWPMSFTVARLLRSGPAEFSTWNRNGYCRIVPAQIPCRTIQRKKPLRQKKKGN